MFSVIRIGATDIEASKAFYDALLAVVGVEPMMVAEDGSFVAYRGADGPMFVVGKPRDGEAPSSNGLTLSFTAKDEAEATALYEKALSLGAPDEGAPGVRRGMAFCAYVRDPDGNKLNFICLNQ